MGAPQIIDRPDIGESNGLVDGIKYHRERGQVRRVDWSEPHLRVTRLRLLSDPGFPVWDVSYCHGVLAHTGELVDVEVPFQQLPKRGFKAAIVAWARREGVYAHGLGILTNISTLN